MKNNKVNLNLNYPHVTRGVIVVWSLIASLPFPGMAWHRLHLLAGLRRLGFDVWYVEETDMTIMNPKTYQPTEDFYPYVNYLARLMDLIGLGNRWIYRPPGQFRICFGSRDIDGMYQLYRDADVVINHTGAQEIRSEHSQIKRLVYLETDPVAIQIEVASGNKEIIRKLDAHNYLFSYGSNLGSSDCMVPIVKYNWLPTRPPVCTDWWMRDKPPDHSSALTTIASWKHMGKDKSWNGICLRWSKHDEFLKFINLPIKSKLPLELAIAGVEENQLMILKSHGWRILPAEYLSNVSKYRQYIRSSLGEFTVAKEQYVASRSGWFSDRSATYLASGCPVITQDTGFGNSLPTGEGLFSFSNEEEALTAIDLIASDYQRHSSAALEIAREYFSTDRVLHDMLSKTGLL